MVSDMKYLRGIRRRRLKAYTYLSRRAGTVNYLYTISNIRRRDMNVDCVGRPLQRTMQETGEETTCIF